MRKKMRTRKSSLLASLVLALSLALSPVSAFADDLDTPVHEDPIDEIQYEDGTSSANISLSYWDQYAGCSRYITGTSNVTYSMAWTEGDYSYFTGLVYNNSNTKLDGVSRTFNPITGYDTSPSDPGHGNANGYAFQDFKISGGSVTFRVRINVSVYGEISHYAEFKHK